MSNESESTDVLQILDDIRREVEARKKEESAKNEKKKLGDGKINNKFIRNCLEMNELGDGILYKTLNKGQFVFNKSSDSWLSWNQHHWQVDQMDKAKAAVERVVEKYIEAKFDIAAQIKELDDKDPRKVYLISIMRNLSNRVNSLRSVRRRHSCLTMAHTCTDPIAIRGDEIDQNPWLLACKNGVIDLKTGEHRPGKPEDYLLSASPTEYKGIDAPCPNWISFLHQIYEENDLEKDEPHPKTEFIQRLFGSAIVGEPIEHIFPVLTGIGRNGKGTLIKVISHVLGSLSGPIRPEMLLEQYNTASSSGPTPDVMALRGLRIAISQETNNNCRVNAAKVKWYTGGDDLVGRNPHDKYEVMFKPTHTIFLVSNYKPHAPADDYAFWERVIAVPHNLSFVDCPDKPHERKKDP
ncbi:MAG: DNA primase, partial [Desulfobacteraceae bacterium]|nr:DNA primase [Desulfobacteraceae bacterium]